MQSGIRSKTKTFVLKSRPEDLVLTNLDIAKYSELSDEMSEAQIVEAIMQGLEDYKAERQDALNDIDEESRALNEHVNTMYREMQEIETRANQIKDEQSRHVQELEALQENLRRTEEETRDQRNQISDLDMLIQTMVEQKNKDVKSCDKASVAAVKRIMQEGPTTDQRDIIAHLTRFLCENQEASFDRDGVELFGSEASFGQAVRRCNPAALDKEYISTVAGKINRDAKGNEGPLAAAVQDGLKSPELFIFYPYFKVLFKLVQSGLTMKRKINLQRKQVQHDVAMAELKIKIETQDALIKNLAFHERMTGEAARMQAGEIQAIKAKIDRLEGARQAIQNANHTADYFKNLSV